VSGPTQQSTNTVIIPPGEGRKSYSPVALAWYVENFEIEEGDTLKSIVGPTTLDIGEYAEATEGFATIDDEITVTGMSDGFVRHFYNTLRPHSIFFAQFLNGSADTLYYRFGDKLYRFRGEYQTKHEVIADGLRSVIQPLFPDQYVLINNQVIFTNGIDRARTISYDGSVEVLGYSTKPSTPMLAGPSQPEPSEVNRFYPNSQGYSWPGRIGTPGDTLTGRKGSLLAGQWYYHFQYEDINGNLSEFSSRSEPVSTKANQADPFKQHSNIDGKTNSPDSTNNSIFLQADGSEIDDLTRRFLVRMSGNAPEHTVATHIYRTPDTRHVDNTPRFLVRVPGTVPFVYDDNLADSELGSPWTETISVPVFRIACAHQGRLIIANIPGDPGLLRRSEVNFPGTFLKDDYIYPDSGGASITGLASHNGVLIAFTENSMYAVGDDFTQPQPISLGIGCSAPRSIAALRNGTLIWLSRDGFYGMKELGQIFRISDPIQKSFKSDINFSRINLAVATFDTDKNEYRCLVAEAGSNANRLMFCFDGQYWRRQTLRLGLSDICTTSDWRRHTYAIGFDYREQQVDITGTVDRQTEPTEFKVNLARVFLLDHQTNDWFGPPRRVRYRSNWILSNESGLQPTNVRSLYVGMKDAWNGNAIVRIYKNGSWKPVQEMRDLVAVGVDDDSGLVKDIAGEAQLDEARVREPRLFWRSVPVDLHNVSSWAFEIEMIGWPAPFLGADDPVSLQRIDFPLDDSRDRRDYLHANDWSAHSLVLGKFTSWDSYMTSWPEWFERRERVEEAGLHPGLGYPPLGRMRLAAFAFDTSIATKGTPLGRVPRRKDR